MALERSTCPVTGFRIERSSLAQVRLLIEGGHYLGKVNSNRSRWAFALIPDDAPANPYEYVGAALFGQPARETVAASLWRDTSPEQAMAATLELTRFYTLDGLHPATGTWFLQRAVRMLREAEAEALRSARKAAWQVHLATGEPMPRFAVTRMLVAFSDEDAGHHGGLYQAASWLYTGTSQSEHYHYVDRDGNRVAKQTPWYYARRQREAYPEKYAGERPADGERRVAAERGWTKVKDKPKRRYVLPLTQAARKQLRLEVLPYPKPGV